MYPIFMIKRNDGKTDNVYECDFKNGSFAGGAQSYSYDDISEFLNIPSLLVSNLAGCKKNKAAETVLENVADKKGEQL